MLVWMFLPSHISGISPVVGLGVLIGTFVAPFLGSSIQIAVALDPGLVVWSQLGNTVGMAVPALASYALQFSITSSHRELCYILGIPLVLCLVSTIWLASLNYAEVFTRAFHVMAARRSAQSAGMPSSASANPQDETDEPEAPVDSS